MRRSSLVLLWLLGLFAALVVAAPVDAGRHQGDELDVSVQRAPVDPDGDLVGAPTDLVVTFRDIDPEVPGVGLREGGSIRITLPKRFVNNEVLPVGGIGTIPGCAPPLVSGCSTAVILQGWPQSPLPPVPDVTWEPDTNTIVVTAKADWLPAGTDWPGPKQVHLMLFGFDNPDRPGNYRIGVEIHPDPNTDEVLRGSGRIRISGRSRPSINPNSQANGGPTPPFPNSLFQTVPVGGDSLTLAFYLWDRDTNAYLGVDFAPGSHKIRAIRDAEGHRIGWVRVRAPKGARNWSLESGGPSTLDTAFVTGVDTGRLTSILRTDPDVEGEYRLTFRLQGGNSVEHTITAAGESFIGVLLPDTASSARWESDDRRFFETEFGAAGVDFEIVNAEGDAGTQQTQAEQLIDKGAKVLVLVNLDSGSGAEIIAAAREAGVKVVDYDRLTVEGPGADVYVSFDGVEVGNTMADVLVPLIDALPDQPARVALLNGDQVDNNALLFREGYGGEADKRFADGSWVLVDEQWVPAWDNQQALVIFEQMLAEAAGDIDAVFAANDGLANAVVSAIRSSNLDPILVSGQDATVMGIQNILAGYQSMSVYKSVEAEAEAGAEAAILLLRGGDITSLSGGLTVSNGTNDIPFIAVTPIGVTEDNIADTVIADGFRTWDEICVGEFEQYCPADR